MPAGGMPSTLMTTDGSLFVPMGMLNACPTEGLPLKALTTFPLRAALGSFVLRVSL